VEARYGDPALKAALLAAVGFHAPLVDPAGRIRLG
jgi:hypothetical protein